MYDMNVFTKLPFWMIVEEDSSTFTNRKASKR